MAKRKKHQRLSDQLRQAIDNSELSRYAICKKIGLDQGAMSRFMSGKMGLEMSNFEAIAELLNMELVERE